MDSVIKDFFMTRKGNLKANFIFNSIYQISNILVPVITLPYLTRTLHAEGMGEYSFAYSVAYYFYLFIRLGLYNYGNRTIASVRDDKTKLSKTFWELFAFQLFMGVILSIVYVGYCTLLAPNSLLAYIFFLVVISGGIDLTWALYGLEEFKLASIRDVSIKVLTTICIFSFVKTADDVWKYSFIYSIGFFVSQLASVLIVLKNIHFVKPQLLDVVSHIKPNCILFLPTIAVSLYKTMDKIMLGSMSDAEQLGYYHSSENIIMVPLAFITALGTVMLPRMSNMLAKNEANRLETEDIFDKSMTFAMFISTSICMGIMTIAQEFVPLFFGQGFEKCIILFNIILPSCIFLAFANVIRTQYLLPRKKDLVFISSLFTGAVINVVLNYILIPRYESIGAAIGTLAAEIAVCVFQAWAVFKEANIGRNIVNSIPFLLAGIAMYSVFNRYTPDVDGAWIALVIKIIICASFYLAVLAVLIGVTKLIRHINVNENTK